MNLENPSYNFDNGFMFNVYNKMMHFKEQNSSTRNLEEECVIKDNNIKEYLKQIERLQNIVVENQFKVNIIIKGKE